MPILNHCLPMKLIKGTDTSKDTVTEASMLDGTTAHDASGEQITGTIHTYDGDQLEIIRDGGFITLDTAGKYVANNIDIQAALQEKTVTENGEITPDEGYAGLGKVTVDVTNTKTSGTTSAFIVVTNSATAAAGDPSARLILQE